MTALRAVHGYESGWHGSGQHDRCAGEYAGTACTHSWHTHPSVASPTEDAPARPVLISGTGGEHEPDAETLTQEVDAFDLAVGEWFETADHVALLDLLGKTRTLRSRLAQVESVLEQRAAKTMPVDVVEWAGGVAQRRFGKDRKQWAHADLTAAVSRRIAEHAATDHSTGETDDAFAAVIHDAIAAYAATNRPEWRVIALKDLGVDPDDYCASSPGKASVQITAAGEQ